MLIKLDETQIKGDNVFYIETPQILIERTNSPLEAKTQMFNSIDDIKIYIENEKDLIFFIRELHQADKEHGRAVWMRYIGFPKALITEEDMIYLKEVWHVR